MTRVFVDNLSPSGLAEGWACGADENQPLGLEFWLENERIGAAKADLFRPDLLAAGIGHGHYGYRCQLKPKSHRHGRLEIREIGTQTVLSVQEIEPGRALEINRRATKPVEHLLARSASWTMADFAGAVAALDAEKILNDLGPHRFIAYVYRFLLDRFPYAHEYAHYLPHMRRNIINARDVVQIVLGSDEHKSKHIIPAAPFDPRYPFKTLQRERPPAASPMAGLHNPGRTAWLRSATLVASPWAMAGSPLQFEEKEARLLCHPPAYGMTVAKIDALPLTGASRLGARLTLPNRASAPVEMALLLASQTLTNEQAAAIFAGAEAAGFTGWKTLTAGGVRTVLCTGNVGHKGAKLYLGSRMAAGAANCDNAWASVSELVALDGLDLARVAQPVRDNVIRLVG
jgi:hypothetical protein